VNRRTFPVVILGIDAGVAMTGWGILKVIGKNHYELVATGCIKTNKRTLFADRLVQIANEISDIIKEYSPDEVAIEELFFARNTRTATSVGEAIGVILEVCARAGLPIYQYTPLEIKQAVVGYGRADKKQVKDMVQTLLEVQFVAPDDTYDAVGCAICHALIMNVPEVLTGNHPGRRLK